MKVLVTTADLCKAVACESSVRELEEIFGAIMQAVAYA